MISKISFTRKRCQYFLALITLYCLKNNLISAYKNEQMVPVQIYVNKSRKCPVASSPVVTASFFLWDSVSVPVTLKKG